MRLGHFNFFFPRNYEVKALESYSLVHPAEKFHQFPAQLEEQDRNGVYVRVVPKEAPAWIGFFALGFESEQVASGIYSCPDPNSLCVAVGGYVYIEVRALPELKLLLFTGFTSITAFGEAGPLWTTEKLSWEGITAIEVKEQTLYGNGWDALADKEVPFEVDLLTGVSKGGARPGK